MTFKSSIPFTTAPCRSAFIKSLSLSLSLSLLIAVSCLFGQLFTSLSHLMLLLPYVQLYVYDESVFGDYECRATNKLGTMARVIVLEQASKPAVPTFKIKVTFVFFF